MAKINRSATTYVKLPDSLVTGSMHDAKLAVSMNVLVPKGMEKRATKFISEMHDELEKQFKKFMKKEISKMKESDD